MTASILSLAAFESRADLICYEPFTNGVSDDLLNIAQPTGSGFSTPWAQSAGDPGAPTTFQSIAGGGNFANGWPRNVGFSAPSGEAQYSDPGGSWAWQTLSRTLSTPLSLTNAGTYYLSFLYDDQGDNNYDFRVFLGSSDASKAFYMGPGYGNSVISAGSATAQPWSLAAGANAAANWPGVSGTYLVFVVAQIQADGAGNVTIKIKHYYYDPVAKTGDVVDISPGSASWEATYTGPIAGTYDQLGISGASPAGPALTEIRLGTNWTAVTGAEDVTAIQSQPQPASQVLYNGYQAAYSVTAVGSKLAYQWYTGASPISGATNANLTVTALTGVTNSYSVVVIGASGSVTSSVVTVSGLPVPTITSTFAINFCQNNSGAFQGQGAYNDTLTSTPLWNLFPDSDSYSGAASDSTGNSTLTSFFISPYAYYGWYGGGSTPSPTDPYFLLGGFAHSTALTISYNNVPPGIYSLYLYSQNGEGGGRGGAFSLGAGNGGVPDNGMSSAQNDGSNPDSFVQGNNYVLFTNVVPNVFGNIVINEKTVPSSPAEADFNGAQLVWTGAAITKPFITMQPQPATQMLYAGYPASYSVAAAGPIGATLSYQWFKGSSPISGATNSGLTVNAVANVTNSYAVVVTDVYGSVTSSVVTLAGKAAVVSAPFTINYCQNNQGAYQGQGAFNDTPSTPVWNLFPASGSTSGSAYDSGNNPTLTTFSISSYAYYAWYGGGTPASTDPYFLLGGFAHGPALTFSFNDVPPGIYSLYLYSQNGEGGNRGGAFALASANGGAADNGIASAQNDGSNPDSFIEGNNYVLFTNVVSDASGNITVYETTVPSSPGEADFNGAQLLWVGSLLPQVPTNISCSVSSGHLTVHWPASYLGWILQSQTNGVGKGLGSTWLDVPGTASVTSTNLPLNPANVAVFYRLRYPN